MGAPTVLDETRLRELNIQLRKPVAGAKEKAEAKDSVARDTGAK